MSHFHRFQHFLENNASQPAEDLRSSPAAFMICPSAIVQAFPNAYLATQFALYQQALELAREMARPSIVERDLLGVWN